MDPVKISRFFALLLAALLLAAFAAPAASAEEGQTVRVSDAQGLLEAIAPNTTVELEPGRYDLTEAMEALSASFESAWVRFEECWDGREAVVCGVDGLSLLGLGEVEIVAQPRMADVLRFERCTNVTLADMTLGHTTAPGACTGDVLEFAGCRGVVLRGLDLYGCGTYGVFATDSSDLRMEGSTIRECSYGILYAANCRGFRFFDCTLRACGGYWLLPVSGSDLSFDGCTFEDNSATEGFVSDTEGGALRFFACRFGPWETAQLNALRESAAGVSFDALCEFAEEGSGAVTVASEQEFFEAIRPGAVIALQPGHYDLGAWIAETWETEGERWNERHPFVRLQECYDGVEAVFCSTDGLCILGLGRDRSETELYVEARYANVLGFEGCLNVSLANLTLGHSEGGPCAGSVVMANRVSGLTLTNVDLYGCGNYGVSCLEGGGLSMRGCTVRSCSGGPMYRYGGWGEDSFEDCVFVDSAGSFEFYESSTARFVRCVFGEAEYAGLIGRAGVTMENCLW